MPRTTPPEPIDERIEDIDVTTEMQGSYLEYAYSVIYSRALPDARDGLKPVQRRILFQMTEMGLRPDRGHVKSARVVGDVMGKLHPHGDAAIYDALVRMAQPFTLRLPLVDGHGNFGSLDDGPAASRYTEARLAPAALAMTESLDEDVVDFVPNYDGQLLQPACCPPHSRTCSSTAPAASRSAWRPTWPRTTSSRSWGRRSTCSRTPRPRLEELMEFVPGPDLPTGGIDVGPGGRARRVRERPRGVQGCAPRCRSSRSAPAAPASSSPNCPTWSDRSA